MGEQDDNALEDQRALDTPDTADSLIRALAKAPNIAVADLSTIDHVPLGAGGAPATIARTVAPVPEPGTIIDGRYLLERKLGAGGMGVVFAARNLHTEKVVALKLLRLPEEATGRASERIARFLREARAAGRVRHPNVVDMIDVGGDPGQPYLVMELLRGRSLWARMQEGPLAQTEVLEIMLSAMRGVAEAHRQGVIHRDLKPDNIFLADMADGTRVTKVLDFGVSRITTRDGDSPPTTLTRVGHVVGTPTYMALEQMRGNTDVDARADVYSLGVVLYEALTGTRPYDAQNEHDLGIKMATESPTPLSVHVKGIEPRLEAAVMRALARKASDRHPNVEAFIEALEQHRSRPYPARHRLLRACAAALLFALIFALWFTQARPRPMALEAYVPNGSTAQPDPTTLAKTVPAHAEPRQPIVEQLPRDDAERPTKQDAPRATVPAHKLRAETLQRVAPQAKLAPAQRATKLLPQEF